MERIKKEAEGFDQIRVVFERYIEKSLKIYTKAKCTHGKQIRYNYKVADGTDIERLSTAQFLSHTPFFI